MKYRGSTRGAVISCIADVASQMRTKVVVAGLFPSGIGCGRGAVLGVFAAAAKSSIGWAPRACMHAQPQQT